MPNSFCDTFFNRHRIQYESGAFANNEFSNVYFFLPSITDRSEERNRYMGSVNLVPIDIEEVVSKWRVELLLLSLILITPRERK